MPSSPNDRRLLALINEPTTSVDERERRRLVNHIGQAPFSREQKTLREWHKVGFDVLPCDHPSKPGVALTADTVLSSAEWHALKHRAQGEFHPNTTTHEYLSDLKVSATHPTAELHVGRLHPPNGRVASRSAVTTKMSAVESLLERALTLPGARLFTLYDPGRQCVVSFYRLKHAGALSSAVASWANYRSLPPT